MQVTQSRRGYMHDNSGSAFAIFLRAVSHRWSLSNLALHSGRQTSIMYYFGSWPFSSIDLIVFVVSLIVNKLYLQIKHKFHIIIIFMSLFWLFISPDSLDENLFISAQLLGWEPVKKLYQQIIKH